ncbi:hypothetical protein HAX54_039018 [Datura stramonium]|uniref:Uncharacterized protein n=1 Tax=Datura stramonium TaxID=4076 RepID=A0ABS8VLB5_DATST|nr:hypothetical protein [Datura stramonium]
MVLWSHQTALPQTSRIAEVSGQDCPFYASRKVHFLCHIITQGGLVPLLTRIEGPSSGGLVIELELNEDESYGCIRGVTIAGEEHYLEAVWRRMLVHSSFW